MVLLSYLSQVIWNEGDVIDSYEIKLYCAYVWWGVSSFVFHAIEEIVTDKKKHIKLVCSSQRKILLMRSGHSMKSMLNFFMVLVIHGPSQLLVPVTKHLHSSIVTAMIKMKYFVADLR